MRFDLMSLFLVLIVKVWHLSDKFSFNMYEPDIQPL